MRESKASYFFTAEINNRRLFVMVFSLFFAWFLAFPFEGRILYALSNYYDISAYQFVFATMAAYLAGLISCGFFVKTIQTSKKLILFSLVICIIASCVFLFPPTFLWLAALVASSFLTGGCMAAWGFYFKGCKPIDERIKTMADGLIYSNILMILINILTVHIGVHTGLAFAVLLLILAFVFALRLPLQDEAKSDVSDHNRSQISINKPIAFLCLFIAVVSINTGLMYQVQTPAFVHLEWLTSWYCSIPYIIALYVMRNLPYRVNRSYILYVAIAMIGFSYISFLALDRSWTSYLIVDTLMLGASAMYVLFWWSILAEMLDLKINPSLVMGIGLSANVLGVLFGGVIGNVIFSVNGQSQAPSLIALAVVCIILVMLPPLHKCLTDVLKNHIYLSAVSELPDQDQSFLVNDYAFMEKLTERESEIIALLIKGKTYRMIAGELHVSENTVKTHVKNIYSKAGVQSRTELINSIFDIHAPFLKSPNSI